MQKYDGWIFKNKWGSFLFWTMSSVKKGIKRKVPMWKEWEKEGHRIIKVKLVEVID